MKIDPNIIISLISGMVMVLTTIITVHSGNTKNEAMIEKNQAVMETKIQSAIDKNQAVTDTKLDELTREVREHNGFAKKVPVLEEKVDNLDVRVTRLESK